MARKTRAEKIASEERLAKIQYSLPNTTTSVTEIKTATIDSSDYSYVFSDLRRIGIFTMLAFGAEILVWVFLPRYL